MAYGRRYVWCISMHGTQNDARRMDAFPHCPRQNAVLPDAPGAVTRPRREDPVQTILLLGNPDFIIAENGGRHELRLEPSVARPQIYSCIGSRHWAGMVLEKRAVQIAID